MSNDTVANFVDFDDLYLHHETIRAILVSDTGNKEDAVWLPKSQIITDYTTSSTDHINITCPEWLAKDKGLI